MSRKHKLSGRVLFFTAICVGLLVLVGWFLSKQVLTDVAGLRANSVASREANYPEMSGPAHPRIRKVPRLDEISKRVRSLLSIRSDEIGLITIPKSAMDQYFNSSMAPSELEPPVPILQSIVQKKSLVSGLEGILKDGGELTVKFAGHDTTEYSGKSFHIKISSVRENDVVSTLRLQMTSNGITVPYEFSLYRDHALIFRLPPPAEVGVAILIGSDPEPPNTKAK